MDSDADLQALSRHTVLNPVRAWVGDDPADCPWSSYRATAGLQRPPNWLTTDGILATFQRKTEKTREAYRRFVHEGIGGESIWLALNRQVFLGEDHFVERMQCKLGDEHQDVPFPNVPRLEPPPSLRQLYRDADSETRRSWRRTPRVATVTPNSVLFRIALCNHRESRAKSDGKEIGTVIQARP